jgi:hypothetical protein
MKTALGVRALVWAGDPRDAPNVVALSNELAIWRNPWDDGMDLAAHARQFMANHAAAGARVFR